MKLCLGTAQFGMNYGINNTHGKIAEEKICEILNCAHDNNIFLLDTASAYGNSEVVLGETISQIGKNFQVITKYPANNENPPPIQLIEKSLNLLKIDKLYGYLFHNYSIFQKHPEYIDDFVKIKQLGKCEKIGFSLYYPYEAEYILKNNIPCDIVQIPFNIFDQRFLYLFQDIKNKGIDIFVRSVFLQGLFFIDPEKLDKRFDTIRDLSKELHETAKKHSINVATLCFRFAYKSQNISYAVIGIDSLDNLKENIQTYKSLSNFNDSSFCFERFAVNDENIILPFNW